ncbi:UDP-N-acetylmuramate--alanine ligase [Janthinobacterium sp. ROICE36]|uniref:gamma-glutamylcyclotransferase family protein n=1 Tax=Janthinobacterium sp. ROICE36 TaxID=2048670 RepID=UPI000C7E8862|nr:gamma-glutamylcyclotransferase family protein [Janthinobacterium sp. ROICE36]PLY45749.1 UDP-N-acetylmuramate--alanine ligase [Janthinobacterium sp. ROICE36]
MTSFTAETPEQLFSYGTLQQADVQLATFGRLLDSRPDQLPGYRLALLAISADELRQADQYEVAAYRCERVTLASGMQAWAYVDARDATP